MEIALIYARSQNYCIGNHGGLPWHLPDDLAFFEQVTLACPVIMGRRTYDEGRAPLPYRLNIVVSRSRQQPVAEGVILADSLALALDHASHHAPRAFVIGGVGLYVEALPLATIVFETLVHADVSGDTIIPAFDFSDWKTKRLLTHEVDARHGHAFSIFRHVRDTDDSHIPTR